MNSVDDLMAKVPKMLPTMQRPMTNGVPWIVSKAHDWRNNPDARDRVVCRLCGMETAIGTWNIPRCIPRNERADSGFIDESDAQLA